MLLPQVTLEIIEVHNTQERPSLNYNEGVFIGVANLNLAYFPRYPTSINLGDYQSTTQLLLLIFPIIVLEIL